MSDSYRSYTSGLLDEESANVGVVATRLELENLTPEIQLCSRSIPEYSVSRPSLQLTGFFDTFADKRVQLVGLTEQEYMKTLDEDLLIERFNKIAEYGVPCIIFTRNLPVHPKIVEVCRKHNVPVLRTPKETSEVDTEIIQFLRAALAPRETIHAELVDVYGVGVLIKGDSGIGKSELALSLIKRGHRLVSDDVVEVRKISDSRLVGIAPALTRDFIELRGIGIVNVRAMFGYEAVKPSQTIDLVVNLEELRKGKNYDRFGLEKQYDYIMGNKIPKVDAPISPGRNVAIIVESAAINYRARSMGYDAPREFMDRIEKLKEESMRKQQG